MQKRLLQHNPLNSRHLSNASTAWHPDETHESAQRIRIMTRRPPALRKMLATTFRKLSDSVRGQ